MSVSRYRTIGDTAISEGGFKLGNINFREFLHCVVRSSKGYTEIYRLKAEEKEEQPRP